MELLKIIIGSIIVGNILAYIVIDVADKVKKNQTKIIEERKKNNGNK